MPIKTSLKTTKLFKRYIDDIIFLSETIARDNIKSHLKFTFEKHNVKLVFRKIFTENYGHQLEFLDVNLVSEKTEKGGFYVKNYTINRAFVNGKSHHPRSIYKSIVFGESVRLRRFCELDCDYLEAIKALNDKCLKSCICKALVADIPKITKKSLKIGSENKLKRHEKLTRMLVFGRKTF